MDIQLAVDRFLKRIGAYSTITDQDIEIAAAYRSLPREQRQILDLVNRQGKSPEEAGASLGIEAAEARALYSAASAAIEARMAAEGVH